MVDEWLASFNGSGVDFVNIDLLVFGREALDDAFDGVLLGVGVVPGEDEAGGSSHAGVLSLVFCVFLLGEHCRNTQYQKY